MFDLSIFHETLDMNQAAAVERDKVIALKDSGKWYNPRVPTLPPYKSKEDKGSWRLCLAVRAGEPDLTPRPRVTRRPPVTGSYPSPPETLEANRQFLPIRVP
jgi:hypothetical protein